MKEGIVIGAMLGLIAGAVLYKHSECTKELFDESEKMIKKEIKNIKK